MPLLDRMRRTIERHALVAPGGRVLVALSGGPDSVALVHLLLDLQSSGDLVVAGVAHYNHRLRGEDADGDERFCRELAASLALPIDVGSADVRAAARETGRSREDATNRDLSIPRNRVRHELIPYLAREFSPAIVDVLAREADIAREDED